MMAINRRAKTELNRPQRRRSGTSINSRMFMIATIRIWTIAFSLGIMPARIHSAMTISEIPINKVSGLENSSPKICATICSCRGTRFKTLQTRPFINQTTAIEPLSILCLVWVVKEVF